jgi:hypothetical protein
MKEMPLSVMLENAKGMMIDAFNQVQEKSNLPAYLMEGIIVDLLSQVRNQKNLELVQDYNRMNRETVSEEGKKEGEE